MVGREAYTRTGRRSTPNPEARWLECPKHGVVLFHRYGRTPRYRCKRCVGEAVTRRLRKVKQTLIDDFGGGCVICGYDRSPGSLHFHHVDPTKKAFGITMGRGRSLSAYREEARKCILVCANCHGEIEAGLIPSPPAGTKLRSLRSMLLGEASRDRTVRD